MFEKIKKKGFQVLALHHAEAILKYDMAEAVTEIEDVLLNVQIPIEEIIRGGGGEGELTQRMRHALSDKYGWRKHNFEIKKILGGEMKRSITYKIDHVKPSPLEKFLFDTKLQISLPSSTAIRRHLVRIDSYLIKYQHLNCKVDPGVEWHDLWSCACNGECPACGTKDIEPIEWIDASRCFDHPDMELPSA